MKAYNKYMDKISVSGSLHQRIMLCANNARPVRRFIMIKRYAVTFACLAVVMLGFFTIPKFMQHNITPLPGDDPSVLQPGSKTPITSTPNHYTLDFNRANEQVATSIHIPGYFWQELTDKETKAVFPALENTHTIKATANFQSDENGATLFNIDANAKSVSGLETYIQIAPGETVLDYVFVFDSKMKSTDVFGTAVTAGYFETNPNSKGLRNVIYFASFKLSDVAYYVELGGADAEKEALKNEISELIGILIEGGVADIDVFHPVVPELREDRLSLEEARADIDFGAYLPITLPNGFAFEDALRQINQEHNALLVNWTKGMGYIDWRISVLDDNDKTRITSVTDTKNYDLSLYPIPRANSVPNELREIVDNPIFLIDELTLDVVQARTYEAADSGDELGQSMRFGVFYGDILVEINVKDVSSDVLIEFLQQISDATMEQHKLESEQNFMQSYKGLKRTFQSNEKS